MKNNWYKSFFGSDYLNIWDKRFDFTVRTLYEIDVIIKISNLKPGKKILDLCCGQGRHSIELAKKGYVVTGVDISNYLLVKAKLDAERKRLKINFVLDDIRYWGTKEKFDLVISMFTSFGYFTDRENECLIERISSLLKKSGRFILDIPNKDWSIRNLKKKSEINLGEISILEEKRYDPKTKRLNTTTKISNKRKVLFRSIRLYSLEEIFQILTKERLEIKNVYRDFDLNRFDKFRGKRMLIYCKKS
jgi:SAM-dependent methyltransferase